MEPAAENQEIKNSGGDAEVITPDPDNHAIEHPLQTEWTMWYTAPPTVTATNSADGWTNNVVDIIDFSTVEDFWRLYNNLLQPSDLHVNSDYHMFKKGISPTWEDAHNAKGGRWMIDFHSTEEKKDVDQAWQYTMLAMIGEAFKNMDEICGAVVSLRKKKHRIALWTRSSEDEDILVRIGEQLKECTGCAQKIGFQPHHQEPGAKRYARKSKYTV